MSEQNLRGPQRPQKEMDICGAASLRLRPAEISLWVGSYCSAEAEPHFQSHCSAKAEPQTSKSSCSAKPNPQAHIHKWETSPSRCTSAKAEQQRSPCGSHFSRTEMFAKGEPPLPTLFCSAKAEPTVPIQFVRPKPNPDFQIQLFGRSRAHNSNPSVRLKPNPQPRNSQLRMNYFGICLGATAFA